MNKYNDEEKNILQEKRNFLLNLRKNKINKKLLEQRNKYFKIDIEKKRVNKNISYFNDSLKNSFIINVKFKFNGLLNKINNEQNFLQCLNELFEFIKNSFNDIDLNRISESLVDSLTIEKIFESLTIKKFINNKEILNLILLIFSCIIFIYNHLQNIDELKYTFISKGNYIDLYSSLFKIQDDEVIYNSLKFIGLLAHDSIKIMEKLFFEGILETIINTNLYDYEEEIAEIKIWCISQFDMNKKYNENRDLCLKIQKFYLFIFDNFLSKNINNIEFLVNYLKVINNLSFCIDEEYIINLISSKIINFLLDSNINKNLPKESILTIIGNMNYISNQKISLELYNITIKFLMDIINDKNNNEEIISLSLWCINNFADYKDICLDIFFVKNLLDIFRNYIIKNKVINENIFNEICIGFHNLIHNANEDKKYIIIKEYNIISLIIQGFKKIEKYENINKLGKCVIELIFALLTIDCEELVNFCRFIFESEGGNEYIFEKINILLLDQNNLNNKDKLNESECYIINFIIYIQTHLLDLEID